MGLPSLFSSANARMAKQTDDYDYCYYIIMSSLGKLQTISEAKANIHAQYLQI